MNDRDECTDTNCPVHLRNDRQGEGEFNYPYFISYVGEYAVYSDTDVNRNVHPEDSVNIAAQAALLLLYGADNATVGEFTDSVLEGFTYVYKVGHGAIIDSEDYETNGSEKYYSKPGDNAERHKIAVGMVAQRQQI